MPRQDISFRPATMRDAEMLLAWRNDHETRKNSYSSEEVLLSDHLKWLSDSLANKNRTLLIAEINGTPVGTVRADSEGEGFELSWTVAPSARKNGVGSAMVSCLAATLKKPIRAEVKEFNIASAKIAQCAGMVLSRKADGVLHFSRGSPLDVFA